MLIASFKRHGIPWLIFTLGVLFYAYEYLLRIFPSLMIPDLMQRFDTTALQLGNLIALYYYSYTLMQIPVGILLDRFGPRRLLPLACFICVAGIYLFHSNFLLIASIGRLCMGLGSAFAFVGTLELGIMWLPRSWFGSLVGFTVTVGLVGSAFTNLLLAKAGAYYGWPLVMLGLAAVGAILVLFMLAIIRDKHTSRNKPLDTFTWRKLGTGLAALLSQRQLWINGLVGCLFYLSLSAFAELWGVPYLQAAYHLSAAAAAALMTKFYLGYVLSAPCVGLAAGRIVKPHYLIAATALITGLLFMGLLYCPQQVARYLAWLLFAIGMFSAGQIVVISIATELSPPHLEASAIALTNTMVMLSGVIAQPLIGYMLDFYQQGHGLYAPNAAAYTAALSCLPLAGLSTGVLSMFLDRRKRH